MASDHCSWLYRQLGLENFRIRRLHDLYSQPASLSAGENVSPILNLNLSFQFMPTASHLPTTLLWRVWFYPLINAFAGIHRLLLGPLKAFIFSRFPDFPQLLLIGWVIQLLDHLCWTCSVYFVKYKLETEEEKKHSNPLLFSPTQL